MRNWRSRSIVLNSIGSKQVPCGTLEPNLEMVMERIIILFYFKCMELTKLSVCRSR